MKEYHDGILLFDLTDKNVWSKAIKDTVGLKEFYQKNISNYMWSNRLDAVIFTFKDSKIKDADARKFVEKIYPTEANFILVKVDDANKRYNELINKGIVIRNRTTQPLCDNCLRLTIGTEVENKKLINELLSISN